MDASGTFLTGGVERPSGINAMFLTAYFKSNKLI